MCAIGLNLAEFLMMRPASNGPSELALAQVNQKGSRTRRRVQDRRSGRMISWIFLRIAWRILFWISVRGKLQDLPGLAYDWTAGFAFTATERVGQRSRH